MVNAHEVQNRSVQVVDVDALFNCVPAEFVSSAISHTALDTAAGQPHRETEGVMFPAVRVLGRRRAPECQPDGRPSLEKATEMDALARQSGYHRFEWMHRKLDGEVFPVEVALNPVEIGGKPAMIVVGTT
jgi:hypothetical protein